jgi:hypothetical protein
MIALIVGGAACVHDDAERAFALFAPDAVFAINNQIIDWPGRIDYAVTLHPAPPRNSPWPGIVSAMVLRMQRQSHRPETWAHIKSEGIDRITDDWGGSSGLFAVKVALVEKCFTRIILAGVPMEAGAAHYFSNKEWIDVQRYRSGWPAHHKEIAPFVRSMSGWTRSQLGEPTTEWLAS